MPSKCWCGNSDLLTYSTDYNRCEACHTLVNSHSFTESIYDVKDESNDLYGISYWTKYFLQLADVSSLSDLHDVYLSDRCLYWLKYLLKYVLPPASVAEIGCGVGQMPYIVKQAGFQETGVELSPKVCEYAQQAFDINMLCGTIENLIGKYDAILFFDLIEHLLNPLDFMKSVSIKTHASSILIIQTPCYNPEYTIDEMRASSPRFEEQLLADQHIFIFSRVSMLKLLNRIGFTYFEFEPAIFGDDYDLFLIASKEELIENTDDAVNNSLAHSSAGWLLRAMYVIQEKFNGSQDQLVDTSRELEVTQANLIASNQQLKDMKQNITLASQDLTLTNQKLTLVNQKLTLTKQDLTLANQKLATAENENVSISQNLADTHKEFSRSQQQLFENQLLLGWNQDQLSETQQQLNESLQSLSEVHAQLTETQNHLTVNQCQLNEANRQLSIITSSKSWMLTKPLRIIFSLTKRIARFMLPYAVVRYIHKRRYGK